jgi:hypothetical protein
MQDIDNISAERRRVGIPVHRFTVNWLDGLPFSKLASQGGRGRRLLLAGWQVAGIADLQPGVPFTRHPARRPPYAPGHR